MNSQRLLDSCIRILRYADSTQQALEEICRYLRDTVPHYDWVGFYVATPGTPELVLGPFAGESTEHVRIPFGRGICGQVAESQKTFVVDDVGLEGNYLSCSPSVRSEIVVPIMANGSFLAEIDIDSHTPDAFGPEDRSFLESLADLLSDRF